MIAFVDDEWSGEIANRLRGVGRYAASRLVVLSYEPGRTRLDARASIAAERGPGAGADRAAARDGDRQARRAPPRRPADDRRPARRDRPADAAVVAARPSGGGRRAAQPRAGDARRLDRGVRLARGARPRERARRASLRRRSRVAALDALARARRGGVRRAEDASRARPPELGDRAPSPGLDGRRRCCSSAGWPRAWAGRSSTRRSSATKLGARSAQRHGEGGRAKDRAEAEGGAGAERSRAGRPRPVQRVGPALAPRPRAAAACTRTVATATGANGSGRCSAPRAARAASSARGSGRRCCATRRTGRRCMRRARCCHVAASA